MGELLFFGHGQGILSVELRLWYLMSVLGTSQYHGVPFALGSDLFKVLLYPLEDYARE